MTHQGLPPVPPQHPQGAQPDHTTQQQYAQPQYAQPYYGQAAAPQPQFHQQSGPSRRVDTWGLISAILIGLSLLLTVIQPFLYRSTTALSLSSILSVLNTLNALLLIAAVVCAVISVARKHAGEKRLGWITLGASGVLLTSMILSVVSNGLVFNLLY